MLRGNDRHAGKSIVHGFTHVLAVDKVTDIASFQAVVSLG